MSRNATADVVVLERVMPRISFEGDCWIYTGARTRDGYGSLKGYGYVHRLMWEFTYQQLIPAGSVVRHRCDNPPCCRPSHLQLGTQADNLADMRNRGRATPPPIHVGETHHSAKLTAEDVRVIRRLYLAGSSYTVLATRFGVRPNQIGRICRRESWRSVP